MLSMLAQIGFDPQIRGILVVGTGVVCLFGSLWLILATNSGIRLASLIALSAFFAWMAIMGGFWWIRGIGFVGDSVSWHVLDFNREEISLSSVDRATDLPPPETFQGAIIPLIEEANAMAAGVETDVLADLGDGASEVEIATELDAAWAEVDNGEQWRAIANDFAIELDRDSIDYANLTDAQFADAVSRNDASIASSSVSQVFSVAPDLVEGLEGSGSGGYPSLNGWELMSTADAGEAQSTAGAAILERDGFHFEAQSEFKFLDAFRTGGKPRISRDNDASCTFCGDNLERGWLWITNSARIKNPTEYSVVQLQALSAESQITAEGQAPPFPDVDDQAQIISVVMVRELGNLRFPPAMVTLGSLLIFVALCYMLHERDLATMARVDEFEAEA